MGYNTEILILTAAVSALCSGILFWTFRSRKQLNHSVEMATKKEADSHPAHERLIFGRPEAPLVAFEPLQLIEHSKSLGSNAHLTASISPLMELIPKAKEIASPAMRVVFSKEVMQGLKNGTLELTKDGAGDFLAVARKVDSKDFFQHGRLLKSGVKLATLASASLQIATLITAQAHLAEIKASLKKIEDRLEGIDFFQKEEKRAELRGAVQLLKQYSDAIARGDLTDQEIQAILTKLEDIEQDCLAIGELGLGLLLKEKKALGKIKTQEIMSPTKTVDGGCEWADRCKELIELITMAHSCRVLGAYVKSTLQGGMGLVNHRINDATVKVEAALQALVDTKDEYKSQIIQPLHNSRKNWLLHPFGMDPFHRNKHVPNALRHYHQTQRGTSRIIQGFNQEVRQVMEVVEQQVQMAENGFGLDVRCTESGSLEVLNISTN
jgi:hypothetical protein